MLTEGDMIVRIRSKESTLSSMILFSTFVYSPYASCPVNTSDRVHSFAASSNISPCMESTCNTILEFLITPFTCRYRSRLLVSMSLDSPST